MDIPSRISGSHDRLLLPFIEKSGHPPAAVYGKGIIMTRLKELRKEKGYTQIKMQHLTGIDQSDYSKIENGRRYLTYEQCRRIAIALDTSMDYLAGLTDEKNPYPRSASLENQG